MRIRHPLTCSQHTIDADFTPALPDSDKQLTLYRQFINSDLRLDQSAKTGESLQLGLGGIPADLFRFLASRTRLLGRGRCHVTIRCSSGLRFG